MILWCTVAKLWCH